MSGDYSRFTFKPRKRFSGVLMQQGRVQLDSDANEQVAIGKRRWETQALDTFGHAAVPKKTTPDGFKISVIAAGDFTIGVGRMYVDGLLAEIFEGESFSYLHQPYLLDPPALPGAGGAIAYLDVWDREVTYIEDGDLLEKALGGPDTATRLQTVWQVKVSDQADECGADLDALFPRSHGQLTTAAAAPPAADDPCILAPTAGYRGLENRLYRVEIQDRGGLGAATFKWSRENASIAARVDSVNAARDHIVVTRIGRDKVLRFSHDDWIEVTDDARELRGDPGVMAKVVGIDEATRTLTINPAIPAAAFDLTKSAERHLRVRRWDQRDTFPPPLANGVITVPAVAGQAVDLEAGIEVSFTLDGGVGELHTGDYWVFAARVVDASIEILDHQPPRGIIHHYAALAAWADVTSGDEPDDCRPLWPDEQGCCCCTFEVGTAESNEGDFQDLPAALAVIAADPELAGRWVRICFLPGRHVIANTVDITRSRLILSGCGPLSIITGPGTLLLVEADEVVVEDLRFEGVEGVAPILQFLNTGGHRMRRCSVETPSLAVVADNVSDFQFHDNEVVAGMVLDAFGFLLDIRRNRTRSTVNSNPRPAAISVRALFATIADNEILSSSGHGILLPGGAEEDKIGSAGVSIERNLIGSAAGCGILAGGADPAGEIGGRIDSITIRDNVIRECANGDMQLPSNAAVSLRHVQHVIIDGNQIVDNGNESNLPVAGILIHDCKGLIIRNNVVTNNGSIEDELKGSEFSGGILADHLSTVLESVVTVAGEPAVVVQPDGWPAALVQGNTVVAPQGQALRLMGVGAMRVTGNNLTAREVLEGTGFRGLIGAVMILNSGVPAYLTRQLLAFGFLTSRVSVDNPDRDDRLFVNGPVDVSNNVVTLDLLRGVNDFALASIIVITLDDLGFQNNQTEVDLGIDFVAIDAMMFGTTLRVTGNGFMESFFGCFFSALADSLLLCTGSLNQGTHCIRIALQNNPAPVLPFGVVRDNVQLLCERFQ
jgi:uncharacterized protein DUF6519/parallel beta helix pectate lyase-like protein